MALHLIKLCVGADSVADLEDWVARRSAANIAAGLGPVTQHTTRMFPKRREEVLGGGSLYWVIKGVVLVRQRVVDLRPVSGEDGITRCDIILDRTLYPTQAQSRRAFQGWRYLRPEDAPADLDQKSAKAPPELRAKLAELGLL
ncbi:MAG: DUF1489 family protein [Parvularculaceae bacterium]|nr:DUF1489 family protein [Parvularculaceae bacterium]